MITHRGKAFGPYSRFRVDVLESQESIQGVGYDADKSVDDGPALAFCSTPAYPLPPGVTPKAKVALRRLMATEGRKIVESTPEWVEAHKQE